MIIFLDTSFLFPYIGIDQRLMELDCELLYSDLSLFELYAKALKLDIKGDLNISLDEIHSNLIVLSKSNRFTKIVFATLSGT